MAGSAGKGRPKGSPNKDKANVAAIMERLKCSPFEVQALIVNNELPCGVCRGTLKTKYVLQEGQHAAECRLNNPAPQRDWTCSCDGVGVRVCQSCHGGGYEACSPDLRGKMAAELAQYLAAKRRAVEISGELGMPDLAAILRRRFDKHKA